MRRLNKTVAGLMAAVMVLLGVSVTPVEADAATQKEVYYDTAAEFKIADYWNATNPVAPVKDGYVFGGWYTAENGTPIKKGDLQEDIKDGTVNTVAVAKFVPSYVLSVKTQIASDTAIVDGKDVAKTYLRLSSAVDSVKYANVGFDVLFNKEIPFDDENQAKTVMSKVYNNLSVYNEETKKDESISAKTYFGDAASHFIALRIDDIAAVNYEKVIYVTPYWTTIDGTKVEGVAKYVRVMDSYKSNRYISIPVNLSVDGQAAAGMVTMTYNSDKLQFVEAKDSKGNACGWDTGVSFTEMEVNTATAGTIKFVGNGKNVNDDYMTGKGIYANVWFQVKKDVKLTTNELEFTIGTESFCTWGEDMLNNKVTAWDVCY
ncbi:MAG: InlB B-repeat-containing protein [Faecalimonas sp.]|nr:InlB B-repeat-containing protein [Faecalimonas sp.]